MKDFLERLGNDVSNPVIEGMASYAPDIAISCKRDLSAGIGYACGGIKTDFIQVEYSREERYELVGDYLMRLVRKKLVPQDSRHVSAFFGWLGRRLMKQYVPETQFSLDWHVKKVDEVKRKYFKMIDTALGELKEWTATYTFEAVNQFFSSLGKEHSVLGLQFPAEAEGNIIDRYVYWLWLHNRFIELFDDETGALSQSILTFKDF